MLDVLLALDRADGCCMLFVIDQRLYAIFFGEPIIDPFSMFVYAAN